MEALFLSKQKLYKVLQGHHLKTIQFIYTIFQNILFALRIKA